MVRVEWLQSALDELAEVWMQADSPVREAITAAAHHVEQLLQSQPYAQGESRSENRRIMFQSPLVVTFRVETEGDRVTVLHVWRYPQRG